jgi:hypothetical protein
MPVTPPVDAAAAAPPADPTAVSPSFGGTPVVNNNFPPTDWSALLHTVVPDFFNEIGTFLHDQLHAAFDGAFTSNANVIGQTPMDLTWNMGPISANVQDVEAACRSVLLFAVILLATRTMLGSLGQMPGVLREAADGLLPAVILLASFGTFVPLLIEQTNNASRAIGEADLSAYFNQMPNELNAFLQAMLLIVLIWELFRLLKKAFWRLGLLAVLLPVGPFCMVAWAIPPIRGLTYWWSRTWVGLLLSQIPSVLALSIGIAVMAYAGGILAFFVSLAFLELAVDLYDIVGGIGQHGTYGFTGSVARTLGVGAVATTLGVGPAMLASAGATTQMSDQQVSNFYGY